MNMEDSNATTVLVVRFSLFFCPTHPPSLSLSTGSQDRDTPALTLQLSNQYPSYTVVIFVTKCKVQVQVQAKIKDTNVCARPAPGPARAAPATSTGETMTMTRDRQHKANEHQKYQQQPWQRRNGRVPSRRRRLWRQAWQWRQRIIYTAHVMRHQQRNQMAAPRRDGRPRWDDAINYILNDMTFTTLSCCCPLFVSGDQSSRRARPQRHSAVKFHMEYDSQAFSWAHCQTMSRTVPQSSQPRWKKEGELDWGRR